MREIAPPTSVVALPLNTTSQYGCDGHQPLSRREIIALDGVIVVNRHGDVRD